MTVQYGCGDEDVTKTEIIGGDLLNVNAKQVIILRLLTLVRGCYVQKRSVSQQ